MDRRTVIFLVVIISLYAFLDWYLFSTHSEIICALHISPQNNSVNERCGYTKNNMNRVSYYFNEQGFNKETLDELNRIGSFCEYVTAFERFNFNCRVKTENDIAKGDYGGFVVNSYLRTITVDYPPKNENLNMYKDHMDIIQCPCTSIEY
jgi:hypothetical protein